jgi:hypothetical protein
MSTGNEIYQQLIANANDALQYAEHVLAKARDGRNPNGTFISKTEKPRAIGAAKKEVVKAKNALSDAYKTAKDYDAKQNIKAKLNAEQNRIKAEQAAEQNRIKAEKAAERNRKAAERDRIKAEKAAERDRIKTEKAAEQNRIKAEKAAERDRAKAESTPKASSVAVTEPPIISDEASDPTPEATEKKPEISLLESIGLRRKELGFKTSDLDKYVVGMEGQKGVRSTIEEYVSQNKERFVGQDPASAAARELMDEATGLSEASIGASHDEAKAIYAKIQFIRELAKKTQGKQSDIAAKLDEIIAPVEEQLKKRTSFQEFIKEKAQTFRKTLPERLVSKIPIVGGILGEFLKQKRETQEELERYSGGLQQSIARRGKRSKDIDISGGRVPRGVSDGVRASDIPSLIPAKEEPKTLGMIHQEITNIKTILENTASRSMAAIGGVPASTIPGLIPAKEGVPDSTSTIPGLIPAKEGVPDSTSTIPGLIPAKEEPKTLGMIHQEITNMKTMLENTASRSMAAIGGVTDSTSTIPGIIPAKEGVPDSTSTIPSLIPAKEGVPDSTSTIPGLIPAKEESKTLGMIHQEITNIKTMLENKFKEDTSDTAELTAREAELEAKRGYGSMSSASKNGASTTPPNTGGFLSNLLSNITSMVVPSFLSKIGGGFGKVILSGLSKIAPNLAANISKQGVFKTALEGMKTIGGKTLSEIKSFGSSIANSNIVKNAVNMTKIAATKTANFVKESSLVKDTKSAFNTVKNFGSKTASTVSKAASPAISMAKDVGGKAIDAVKNFGSKTASTVSKAASPAISMAKDVGGKALELAKNVGGKSMTAASKIVTPVATAAKSAATSVGSVLSSSGSTAAKTATQSSGWLSKAWGSVKNTASKLNPMNAVGTFVKSNAAKVAKGLLSFPGIGSLISGAIGAYQINAVKSNTELSEDEKKDQIGKLILTTLGGIIGSIGGGALGSLIPVPGIGTLLGTVGGGMLGDYIAGQIGETVGGKAIYDMVSSIPGIGSLIDVDSSTSAKDAEGEGEAGNTDNSRLSAVNASASATEAAILPNPMSTRTAETITPNAEQATGFISPTTPNTNLSQMMQRYNSETNALNQATDETQNQMLMTKKSGFLESNKTINTNVSSTVNNFRDDLRQRNNEPTVKTMQANSVLW